MSSSRPMPCRARGCRCCSTCWTPTHPRPARRPASGASSPTSSSNSGLTLGAVRAPDPGAPAPVRAPLLRGVHRSRRAAGRNPASAGRRAGRDRLRRAARRPGSAAAAVAWRMADEAFWLAEVPFFDVRRQRIWVFWRRVLHTAHHRAQVGLCPPAAGGSGAADLRAHGGCHLDRRRSRPRPWTRRADGGHNAAAAKGSLPHHGLARGYDMAEQQGGTLKPVTPARVAEELRKLSSQRASGGAQAGRVRAPVLPHDHRAARPPDRRHRARTSSPR